MATPRLAKIQLPGADGLPLRLDVRSGAREGERRPAVVICHGFKGFKDWGFFPRLSERLALAGFTAISFNFSGSGVSDGEEFDEPDRWAHQRPTADLCDLGAVADYAARNGTGWLGIVGHSRGGGLAALHAARDVRVKSLVTWAAIETFLRWPAEAVARWRRDGQIDVANARTGQVLPILIDALDDFEMHREELDVVAAAHRIRAPWLIVHGAGDPTVSVDVARQLAEASGSPKTEVFISEKGDHTFGARHPWKGSTPEFDEVLERTVKYLVSAL